MAKQESLLSTVTDFDFVRVLNDSASRKITKTNFGSAIKSTLIALGFITTDDLPVSVSQERVYREVTSNDALLSTDSVLGVDTALGDVTINLMTATSVWDAINKKGRFFTIKNVTDDTNKVIVNANGSDLIDGEAFIELDSLDFPYITLMVKDTTNWIVL